MATAGYNLYRSAANSAVIDYNTPVGFAAAGAGVKTVVTNVGVTHAPSSFYWYGLRAITALGREETNTTRIWRVEFDADVDLVLPKPNAPFGLAARPVSKLETALDWRYDPTGEAVRPEIFNIYLDGVLFGTANYSIGMRVYQANVTHTFAATHSFRVRAVSADEMEEDNVLDAVAAYDGSAPPAVTGVTVEEF